MMMGPPLPHHLLLLVAVLSLSNTVTSSSTTSSPPPPNILIILADDPGFGDVGFNAIPSNQHIPGAGGTVWTPNPPRTPNLDALASDPATIVFDRFYSGSPVCSPTRSSLLSGRTPDRDCIFNAEGCGQMPAWSCVCPDPFPASTTPTIAEVLSSLPASPFRTLHAGKWHLGDFFPKQNPDPSYAYQKWPVVHPGMLGFSDWMSTEASASSTMCNCGCDPSWPLEPPGCVIGGGVYVLNQSFPCTNYWGFTDEGRTDPACRNSSTSTLACVTNSTTKIPGDDTLFLVERFRAFLNASAAAAAGSSPTTSTPTSSPTSSPFFATLQLHTNHVPHPSLPYYYHLYNGTDGRPAGDYLGTLTQMDNGVGAILQALDDFGVRSSTIIFYTADNGPMPGKEGDGAGGIPDVHTATNGLRQCKASVFEGGIRVPALVHWPGVITENRRVSTPAFVPDIFPTLLDLVGGLPYPRPGWAVDGESILPLLVGGTNATWGRTKFLAWRFGAQVALLDPTGRYKLVKSPEAGLCAMEPSTYLKKNGTTVGPFLFDLLADPTESSPVLDNPAVFDAMVAQMQAWESSIAVSQVQESQCLPPDAPNATAAAVERAGLCLGALGTGLHAGVVGTAACPPAAAGKEGEAGQAAAAAAPLVKWDVDPTTGLLTVASAAQGGDQAEQAPPPSPTVYCFHTDLGAKDPCAEGMLLWMGDQCVDGVTYEAGGTLAQPTCPGMCAGVLGNGSLALAPCGDPRSTGWTLRNVTTGSPRPARWPRGVYRHPFE
jgi:arylsulfatase A-like enzyme